MSAARLLYVGSSLPYCPLAAPYGFIEGGPDPIVTSEGPGSAFPLILTPDEYAYYFWRVNGYTLSGSVSIDYTRVDPFSEESHTWTGASTFEIEYERSANERNLICASNTDDQSPFQVGEQVHTFTGTYASGETSEEASFSLSLYFGPLQLIEVNWKAVGLSQTESGKLAASVGIRGELGGGALGEIIPAVRIYSTDMLTPESPITQGNPIANVQFLLAGEEEAPLGRTVPIYALAPTGEFFTETEAEALVASVTFENLKFTPSSWYEYALRGQPALYDSETGQVIGDL